MTAHRYGIRNRKYVLRILYCVLLASFFFLTSCLPATRPILKIGLVAPFEGRYRDVGYEINYAVRLAIREANQVGGVAGYAIELLAFDDSGDPEMAIAQARKVTTDPQVIAVLGHWLDSTTLAAAPIYDASSIPFIATTASPDLAASAFRLWLTEAAYDDALPAAIHCPLPCDSLENLEWLLTGPRPQTRNALVAGPPLWQQSQFASLAGGYAEGVYVIAPAPLPVDATGANVEPNFAERYHWISNGVEPRSLAVLAYDAIQIIFNAITRDVQANGTPTRTGVAAALAQSNYSGLSGNISFDSNHNWIEAIGWVYEWQEGNIIKP